MADISDIMGGFDADAYEEKPEYDNSPLPNGDYYVEVEKAEVKETQKGGSGCSVQFAVLGHVVDKSQKGKKTFMWFNLQNASQMCQDIGQREFHSLRLAVGKPTATDTDELVGQTLVIRATINKKEPEKNNHRYIALEGYDASKAEAPKAAPTPQAAPAAAAKKNPWD